MWTCRDTDKHFEKIFAILLLCYHLSHGWAFYLIFYTARVCYPGKHWPWVGFGHNQQNTCRVQGGFDLFFLWPGWKTGAWATLWCVWQFKAKTWGICEAIYLCHLQQKNHKTVSSWQDCFARQIFVDHCLVCTNTKVCTNCSVLSGPWKVACMRWLQHW